MGQPLGFKTLIKPSREAQQRCLRCTGTVIRQYRAASQETLIQTLRPIITGWSRYHAHVVSKAIFARMYHRVLPVYESCVARFRMREEGSESHRHMVVVVRSYPNFHVGFASSWRFIRTEDANQRSP